MNSHGNSKTSDNHHATVSSLTLLLALAALGACGNGADSGGGDQSTGKAGNGGAPSGGSSSAGGPAASAGQTTAGQSALGGQSQAGGQPATGGQGGSGGQAATGGGQGGSSGQTAAGGQGAGGHGGTGALGGAGGQSSMAGSGGTGACPHVQMKGSDFCTIGDSWIQLQGNQVTTLEAHLAAAGVIPQGDHFDRREVSGSTLSSIISTYNNKPSNCKILIMDGGGIDLFSTPAGDQAAIEPVVKKFTDFLAKVKTDGYVQHIIYSLYPVIPTTMNLNTNMKPGFSAACAASAVDCHLVDLEPLFHGQHFASDNTHADTAGGVIIGDAWWKAMQEHCIAQ